MSKGMERLAGSVPFQLITTLAVYFFYGALLGICLVPSAAAVAAVSRSLGGIFPEGMMSWPNLVLICLSAGAGLFVFFIAGILVMGVLIRLLSLGIGPGTYPVTSPVVLRWMIFSGVYNLVVQIIIPVIPMTLFSQLFYRLMGCRIGRNVQINTNYLNDCYLLTIEDDVIIGGQTDISCHIFENGKLHLKPVRIGKGSMIGAHCYISPGVTVGENSVIGLSCYLRQDRQVPPGSRLTSVAAVDFATARRVEKGLGRPHRVTRRDIP